MINILLTNFCFALNFKKSYYIYKTEFILFINIYIKKCQPNNQVLKNIRKKKSKI